jgi:hypothetical protein
MNSLFAQDENELYQDLLQSFFKMSQKENTDSLLVDYLSDIETEKDIIYTIIFQPMMCPRCEAEINLWFEFLYKIDPEIETALIAIYPNEKAASNYFEKKDFYAKHFKVEPTDRYKDIFAFSTTPPRVSYLAKIDKKNGRLIVGGEFAEVNQETALKIYQQEKPQPYYGSDWEGSFSYALESSGNCLETEVKQPFSVLTFQEQEAYPISNITYSSVKDGMMSFVDELENKVYLYAIEEDKMRFLNTFMTDSIEEVKFVDPKISKERYAKMKKNNMVIAMCVDSKIINKEELSFTVSLPNLILEDDGAIGYFNKICAITRSINGSRNHDELIAYKFIDTDESYFTGHEYYDYIENKDQFVFIKQKICWPMGGEEISENTPAIKNPFLDDFYNDAHVYSVYYKDSLIASFGNIDSVYKHTKTGYSFMNPRINNNGKTLAVTCGTSGVVHLYDLKDFQTPFSSFNVFDLDVSSVEIDTTILYTMDYLYQFQDFFFLNKIEDLLVRDNSVCCLSYENGCLFFKEFSFSGEIIESFAIKDAINGYFLQEYGLCELNNSPKVYATFRDNEGMKIAFY